MHNMIETLCRLPFFVNVSVFVVRHGVVLGTSKIPVCAPSLQGKEVPYLRRWAATGVGAAGAGPDNFSDQIGLGRHMWANAPEYGAPWPGNAGPSSGVSESQRHQRLGCTSETCIRSSVPPECIIVVVTHNSGTARQHNSATCSSASAPICDVVLSVFRKLKQWALKENNIERWWSPAGLGVARGRGRVVQANRA